MSVLISYGGKIGAKSTHRKSNQREDNDGDARAEKAEDPRQLKKPLLSLKDLRQKDPKWRGFLLHQMEEFR